MVLANHINSIDEKATINGVSLSTEIEDVNRFEIFSQHLKLANNKILAAALGLTSVNNDGTIEITTKQRGGSSLYLNETFQSVDGNLPEGIAKVYTVNYGSKANDEKCYQHFGSDSYTAIPRGIFLVQYTNGTGKLFMGLDKSVPISDYPLEKLKEKFSLEDLEVVEEEKYNGEACRFSAFDGPDGAEYILLATKTMPHIVSLESFEDGSFLSYFSDKSNVSYKFAKALSEEDDLRESVLIACRKYEGSVLSGEFVLPDMKHITSVDVNGKSIMLKLFTVTTCSKAGNVYTLYTDPDDIAVPLCTDRTIHTFHSVDEFLAYCSTLMVEVDKSSDETLTSEGRIMKLVLNGKILVSLKNKKITYEFLRIIRELKQGKYNKQKFVNVMLSKHRNILDMENSTVDKFLGDVFEILADGGDTYLVKKGGNFQGSDRGKFIDVVEQLLENNSFKNLTIMLKTKQKSGKLFSGVDYIYGNCYSPKQLDTKTKVIAVTGLSCSGKTTFAKYLSTNLPGKVLHLDSDVHAKQASKLIKTVLNYDYVVISACTLKVSNTFLPNNFPEDNVSVVQMFQPDYPTFCQRFFARQAKDSSVVLKGGFKDAEQYYSNQLKGNGCSPWDPTVIYQGDGESFETLANRVFPDVDFSAFELQSSSLEYRSDMDRIYYNLDSDSTDTVTTLTDIPAEELHVTLLNLTRNRKQRVAVAKDLLESEPEVKVVSFVSYSGEEMKDGKLVPVSFSALLVTVDGKSIRSSDKALYHVTLSTENFPAWKVGSNLATNLANMDVTEFSEPLVVTGSLGVETTVPKKSNNNNKNQKKVQPKSSGSSSSSSVSLLTCTCCKRNSTDKSVTFSKKAMKLSSKFPDKVKCTHCNSSKSCRQGSCSVSSSSNNNNNN